LFCYSSNESLSFDFFISHPSSSSSDSADRVEPNLIALHSSRGYETPSSKLFMRYTVLLSDLLVFLSAVVVLLPALHRQRHQLPDDASSESSESGFVRDIHAAVDGKEIGVNMNAADISSTRTVGEFRFVG
jgi:hypothetical protein